MKIAIIGAGAVGSLLAMRLSEVVDDVVLIGREDQVESIQANGLIVDGVEGSKTYTIKALPRLDQEYDLVIFAMQTQDVEQAYQDNVDYLENCYVMSVQRGVQAESLLGFHFERNKIFSSLLSFGATYIAPGHIRLDYNGSWFIGKPTTTFDQMGHQVVDVLDKTFDVQVVDNILGMKWLQLVCHLTDAIQAITDLASEDISHNSSLCQISVSLLSEGIKVLCNSHVEFESIPDCSKSEALRLLGCSKDEQLAFYKKQLAASNNLATSTNTLRRTLGEIDFINGEVVAVASQMQQESFFNKMMVALVHDVLQKNRFLSTEELIDAFEPILN